MKNWMERRRIAFSWTAISVNFRSIGKLHLGEKSLTFAGGEQTIWKIRLHTMYLLGRNARYASAFGRRACADHGQIQSRTYIKKLSDTLTEERTAYEVSVSKLECVEI